MFDEEEREEGWLIYGFDSKGGFIYLKSIELIAITEVPVPGLRNSKAA